MNTLATFTEETRTRVMLIESESLTAAILKLARANHFLCDLAPCQASYDVICEATQNIYALENAGKLSHAAVDRALYYLGRVKVMSVE